MFLHEKINDLLSSEYSKYTMQKQKVFQEMKGLITGTFDKRKKILLQEKQVGSTEEAAF